ncbi:GerMN domain-containing protein [Microcoleus sp. herbarium14]|uniref:GerMN domain-containing protein n=1 Tax=Microcoleus sp. herbarium14 TaxID=3055439 RepID=UPI002FD73C23
MKDGQQEVRRVSTAVIAGVCGLALVAGGGIAWWTANRSPTPADTQSSAPTTAPALSPSPAESPVVIIPVPTPTPVQVPAAQVPAAQAPEPRPKPLQQTAAQTVQVYWVKDASGKFEGVPTKVAVKQADKPDAALQAAFNSLLAGPKDATVSSEIPKGTKLRSLSVKNDGVYVDLSAEFTAGGGSTSMTSRLGQVIYTATSLQPNTKVWIAVEGKPLELLGGEGLEVAQPSTRQSFDKNFPLQ